MTPGDTVYILQGREIHAVIFWGPPAGGFEREKWCSVAAIAKGWLSRGNFDVPLADVFPSDYAARVALHNRKAAQIAEAEAAVARLAAFDPFAVVVQDRTGAA